LHREFGNLFRIILGIHEGLQVQVVLGHHLGQVNREDLAFPFHRLFQDLLEVQVVLVFQALRLYQLLPNYKEFMSVYNNANNYDE